jgi:hypothetical protein
VTSFITVSLIGTFTAAAATMGSSAGASPAIKAGIPIGTGRVLVTASYSDSVSAAGPSSGARRPCQTDRVV